MKGIILTNSSMTFYASISTIKLKWFLFEDLHTKLEFSLGILIDTVQYLKIHKVRFKIEPIFLFFEFRKYYFTNSTANILKKTLSQ